MPRRQSSQRQTSLEVEERELAESVESVRSRSAGGSGDGEDVRQAPAFSILATRSVSMSDRGLSGADTTGGCVCMFPDDAVCGGGVGLRTSEVILERGWRLSVTGLFIQCPNYAHSIAYETYPSSSNHSLGKHYTVIFSNIYVCTHLRIGNRTK
ncbi:hypothetical protein C0J52_04387 [Blattella germanica]|nr:hypothetical protein C0J52_04387 [Blattella germanica]